MRAGLVLELYEDAVTYIARCFRYRRVFGPKSGSFIHAIDMYLELKYVSPVQRRKEVWMRREYH